MHSQYPYNRSRISPITDFGSRVPNALGNDPIRHILDREDTRASRRIPTSLPRLENYRPSPNRRRSQPNTRYPPPPPGSPPTRHRRRHRRRNPPVLNPLSITERENRDIAIAIKASLKDQKMKRKPLPSISSNNNPIQANDNAETKNTCPICLEEIKGAGGGPMSARAITCGHVFHRKCLMKWDLERRRQGKQEQCPICRHPQ